MKTTTATETNSARSNLTSLKLNFQIFGELSEEERVEIKEELKEALEDVYASEVANNYKLNGMSVSPALMAEATASQMMQSYFETFEDLDFASVIDDAQDGLITAEEHPLYEMATDMVREYCEEDPIQYFMHKTATERIEDTLEDLKEVARGEAIDEFFVIVTDPLFAEKLAAALKVREDVNESSRRL